MPGAIIRNPTPDWLKPENASVFDSYWKQIARTVGHLIGADDPAAQVMTPLMTDASAAGTALSGAAQAVVDAAKSSHAPTRNYAVFDDKLIDILRKYGVLPPVAGLGYLSQVGQPQKPEPR